MRISGSPISHISPMESGFSSASMVDNMTDNMVDKIVESESIQINAARQRRDQVESRKKDFKQLDQLLSKLQATADGMKSPQHFQKLALDISHPESLTGTIGADAVEGAFEIEIGQMARPERHLAFGFSDASQSEVGFGFLNVVVNDKRHEVVIDPGSNLLDVASKINDSVDGIRAMVINTGAKDNPFRLMVSNIETGERVPLEIDADTTFLDFNRQVKGRDLSAKFEGIDIAREDNSLNDLIQGVNLKAMKAAPGTNISVRVTHDIDRTADGIKQFVETYNAVNNHSRVLPDSKPDKGAGNQERNDSGEASPNAKQSARQGESVVRQVHRSLQATIADSSLFQVGITTNPKTGELKVDESILRDSLVKDYAGVSSIFATTDRGQGLASKLSEAIKALQDRSAGAVATRIKGIEERIKRQDEEISRKEERLASKKVQLERTFANLDARMSELNSQSETLRAR